MANSDVLIVGGGVIGLSIARELHRKEAGKITVVERGSLGKEASYAAAGMLAPNVENEKVGDFSEFCSASFLLYPAFAEEILAETGMDIELDRSGTLYLAFNDADVAILNERYKIQEAAEITVAKLAPDEILRMEPNVSNLVRESLHYPNDWQIDNRKLLSALRRYAGLNGIDIREQTEVRSLITESGKVTGAASRNERFLADVTVLATGAWTSLIKIGETPLPVKVKPIRGQMLCFHPPQMLFQKVIFSQRGYIVPRRDGRVLAGATVEDAGFDKSITGAGAHQLLQTAIELAPRLSEFEIVDQWAGLRPFAADGFPVLGEVPGVDNLIVATAHFRNGILLALLTARLIGERVVEKVSSKYLDIFGVDRQSRVFDAKIRF